MRLHPSLQYKISRVIFHKYAKIFWEIDLLACKFVAGYFFKLSGISIQFYIKTSMSNVEGLA